MAKHQRPEPKNLPAQQSATDQAAALNRIARMVNERRRALEPILPKAFSPDKMVALCLQSLRKNPKIAECDPDSVIKAIFECAKLGLEPDTPAALCHLIPYKNECQFVLGYQGAKVLAARSSDVAKVWAEHRHEHDEWRMVRGTSPSLHHVPADGDRGRYMGSYAVVEYRDPRLKPSFEYVTAHEMAEVEAHSFGCDVGKLEEVRKHQAAQWYSAKKPWIRWRGRMRLKTAVKRVCKQLIAFDAVGAAMAHAFKLDDQANSNVVQVADSQLQRILEEPSAKKQLDAPEFTADDAPRLKPSEDDHDEPQQLDEPDAVPAEAVEKRGHDQAPTSGSTETDPEDERITDAMATLAHTISNEFDHLRGDVARVMIDAGMSKLDRVDVLQKMLDEARAVASGGLSAAEEDALAEEMGGR